MKEAEGIVPDDILEMENFFNIVSGSLSSETLTGFVEEAAAKFGSRVAIEWIDSGRQLSYSNLNKSASRLASKLLLLGVRKGTHVAVMIGNNEAYPITWIALSKLGAVIVPVNTAYKKLDLEFVLNDSDAQFFIVDEAFLSIYESIVENLDLIVHDNVVVHGGSHENYISWASLVNDGDDGFIAPYAVSGNNLLNIQYTSGTTGFPKGCMLSHDYWLIISAFAAAPLLNDDVKNTLIWQPFYYMDGMWLLLLTMRLGGTAYVASSMRLSLFYEWLERYRINYCIFPEAALKIRRPSEEDKKLPLKHVSIYGWSVASRLEANERFSARIREGYGMTEIGLATVVPNVAQTMSLERSCGMAGPYRELKVVDSDGNELPAGETGELWVTGRSIVWGYYKRPEANKKSFHGEWFKTGDIFYKGSNGYYYFVGRSKDMIKRAGENIAAKEVEAAICLLDEVAEVAVVGVPDPLRREEVKAYVLLREGYTSKSCTPDMILSHCANLLAAFKIPRYITYVDDFPRTPSRKIRKHELFDLDRALNRNTYDRYDFDVPR